MSKLYYQPKRQPMGQMIFSDDDLKRLKEYYGVGYGDEPMIEALLARLSAAEVSREIHHLMFCHCAHCEAWRKICGK